jgi:hypothetical protein
MATVKEALEQGKSGMYFDNRLMLPFVCDFIKVIADKYMITDFSPHQEGISIVEHKDFTDVYFNDFKRLRDVISKYEHVKLLVVEKEDDIFDTSKHVKLAIYLEDRHHAKIETTDQDILFVD